MQRVKDGRPEGITTVRDNFGESVIESKRVVLSDFSQLYKAIAGLRSNYVPKILRKLKKDIYELVRSGSPKERICVVDIDDSTEMETVEYVMGVGVSKLLAGQGYGGLDVKDLLKDLIADDVTLDPKSMVEIVLPKLGKQCSFNLPVFKYLSQTNEAEVTEGLAAYLTEVRSKGDDYWVTKSMRRSVAGKVTPQSIEEIIENNDCKTAKGAHQALNEIAFVPSTKVDLESLRKLLVELYERFDPIQNKDDLILAANFRRSVRIYDWLKYGHKKTPEVPKGEEAV